MSDVTPRSQTALSWPLNTTKGMTWNAGICRWNQWSRGNSFAVAWGDRKKLCCSIGIRPVRRKFPLFPLQIPPCMDVIFFGLASLWTLLLIPEQFTVEAHPALFEGEGQKKWGTTLLFQSTFTFTFEQFAVKAHPAFTVKAHPALFEGEKAKKSEEQHFYSSLHSHSHSHSRQFTVKAHPALFEGKGRGRGRGREEGEQHLFQSTFTFTFKQFTVKAHPALFEGKGRGRGRGDGGGAKKGEKHFYSSLHSHSHSHSKPQNQTLKSNISKTGTR